MAHSSRSIKCTTNSRVENNGDDTELEIEEKEQSDVEEDEDVDDSSSYRA